MLDGTENVELVAMADIFEDRLEGSLRNITEKSPKAAKYKERVKVDGEHRFVGFDAYKKLINSDIDVVMLATPPGYRPSTSRRRSTPRSTSSARSLSAPTR